MGAQREHISSPQALVVVVIIEHDSVKLEFVLEECASSKVHRK
jgi:hypothetical protein